MSAGEVRGLGEKQLITVGITSIGSGVGQSIIQSCRLSRLALHTVGLGSNPMAFGAFDCDERRLVPPIKSPNYLDELLRACVDYGIKILIPGLDYDLPVLAAHRQQFAAEGVEVLIAGEEMIRLCRDKVWMSEALRRFSPAFVPSYDRGSLMKAAQQGQLEYPLLAKPRGGFASRGLIVILNEDDLEAVTDDQVIQPLVCPHPSDRHYVDFMAAIGQRAITQVAEISIQLVVSKSGKLLGRMASYNKLNNGVPIEIFPIEDARIWEPIDAVFPFLVENGLRGPLNIQGRLTAQGLRLFEMNARFTGITGLRAIMGFNEVETLIADFLGLESPGLQPMKINARRVGLRQVSDRTVPARRDSNLEKCVVQTGLHPGQNPGRNVLITGGAGYLGRNLVAALLKESWVDSLVALVRNPAEASKILGSSDRRLRQVEWHDGEKGRLNLGEIDLICHLAFGRPPDGAAAIAESLARTRDLCTLISQFHVPAVVNISSQAIYGMSRPPLWTEDASPAPETPYAQAKWAAELMMQMCAQLNPVTKVTSVRLGRLYGAAPGLRWSEFPHLFAQQAMEAEPIVIRGGTQQLDLLHVHDAVDGLLALLRIPEEQWNPIYNLGSGNPCNIREIADAAVEAAVKKGSAPTQVIIQPDSVRLAVGMDISRITQDTGWKPRITLRTAMSELADLLVAPS
jgi:nucleoside-diphosphate-sugar epimerase